MFLRKASATNGTKLRRTYSLLDLSSLSISSVGPAFSISAAAGVMIGYSGLYSLLAVALIALPFLVSAFIFRMLNHHFPQSGASYHWSARVLGARASRFQGWVIMLAYFTSLPPIVLPAAQYTIALINPVWQRSTLVEFAISTFWLLFAMLPLLSGARPTARITQVFLAIEVVFLVGFATLGAILLPHAHFPKAPAHVPVAGILLTMVVATTILDGWEIDSYASEEAARPKQDPGLGGIIGAIGAVVIYAVLFPLLLAETPISQLANSPDPLVAWTHHLTPLLPPYLGRFILVPILASTAGSLWLTGYILIRAMYAMGRDRLLPRWFAQLNRQGAPGVATWVVFVALWVVTILQLFVSSLDTFFAVILSAAGFFLTLEFMLDSVTATVFLWRQHARHPHAHRAMAISSAITGLYLGGVLIAFLLLSPRIISPWTDGAVTVLLVAGGVFTVYRGKHTQTVHMIQLDDKSVEST
ncbi:MAG: APC family permease [Firmicutes bacterium]|nr:APC family permease [Bacillota bacterium]